MRKQVQVIYSRQLQKLLMSNCLTIAFRHISCGMNRCEDTYGIACCVGYFFILTDVFFSMIIVWYGEPTLRVS